MQIDSKSYLSLFKGVNIGKYKRYTVIVYFIFWLSKCREKRICAFQINGQWTNTVNDFIFHSSYRYAIDRNKIFNQNFSFIRRRHHNRRRAVNFGLCSAFIVIEQSGFFNVLHLLWHGTSVFNGHLQGPMTLTPVAERLVVELSLPAFTTYVCRGCDSNIQPSACRANARTHCHVYVSASVG